jgi:hypothetical protein
VLGSYSIEDDASGSAPALAWTRRHEWTKLKPPPRVKSLNPSLLDVDSTCAGIHNWNHHSISWQAATILLTDPAHGIL